MVKSNRVTAPPGHSEINSTVHALVDLRLLLPGGMNGGIKPGFFGLFKQVRRQAGDRLRCTFITNTWSHGDIAELRQAGDRVICGFALENRPVSPEQLSEGDQVQLDLGQGKLPDVSADVYYNPMSEKLPDTGQLPVLILVADLLHRDVVDALPPQEVARRETFWQENMARADRIQTISRFSAERIEADYPAARGKVFFTHLPVQHELRQNDPSEPPLVAGDYFIYPANFWPHKNHEFLLQAFARYRSSCPDARTKLVLTGHRDDRARQVNVLIVELGLAYHVVNLGHLPSGQFSEVFRQARALLFPSRYEGFGIPPLEAMHAGVPVLCSPAGSLPEVVGHGAWVLPLEDPAVWADAMCRLDREPALREEYIARGQKVAASFSLANEADKVWTSLQDLTKFGAAVRDESSPSNPTAPPGLPAPPDHLLNLPNWRKILASHRREWERRSHVAKGPKILVATTVGGGAASAMSTIESLLAVALTWREARVEILLCDQQLPACKSLEWITSPDPAVVAAGNWNTTKSCAECWETGRHLFEPLGLSLHRLSSQLTEVDRAEAAAVAQTATLDNVTHINRDGRLIGEPALAGTMAYFAQAKLAGSEEEIQVMRRYVEASVLIDIAAGRIMADRGPDVVLTSQGQYVPYAGLQALARSQGRRFVTWNLGYRHRSLIFSEGETCHHSLQHEPADQWESMPWSASREQQTKAYLQSWLWGQRDWNWSFEPPHENIAATLAEKGVKPDRPVITLFTNVIRDAQLHYPTNTFDAMMDWLHETIDWFARHAELQLVVRVHPAEQEGAVSSRQKVMDELGQRWPDLPANVFALAAEEQVSTYALAEKSDTVLIFGTGTAVEMAARGIPVIVAGEAWVRGKGITTDASSPEHYRSLLEQLPRGKRLEVEVRQRALKYAYHFFFRKMIPLRVLEPAVTGWPPFYLSGDVMRQLDSGRDAGLDCVLEGIMAGEEFCFRDEWKQDTD